MFLLLELDLFEVFFLYFIYLKKTLINNGGSLITTIKIIKKQINEDSFIKHKRNPATSLLFCKIYNPNKAPCEISN